MDRRQSKKIKPGKIIRLAGANLKKTKSEKHSLESNEIEKKNSLRSERFRINFDFIRLKKVKKETDRKTRFAKKKLMKKNNIKLMEKLDIGDCVLGLGNRLKKKDAPGKYYKSSTQNKSFFNKYEIFLVKKRKKNRRNLLPVISNRKLIN